VHDFLVDLRGAERVFLAMCELWPQADVFSVIYDEDGTEGRFAHRNVQTSFLQKVRPSARTFRNLLPLYPAAVESLDLSQYDLVVSSSSAWAHAVLCDERTVHVSYCHNPFRYVWNDRERTLAQRDPISRAALRRLFWRWRQWDWIAAQRVTAYLTNSHMTQARIKAYWGRDAKVVYPPVETSRFEPSEVGDHYVVLSELMSHKRIDIAIEAFNRLGLPLVVAGDGPDLRRLKRLAGPTVRFAGRVADEQAAQLLQSCRALVVTANEEFGIAGVEAQAAGRPVIAAANGGALENVNDGVTGRLWAGGPEELVETIRAFDTGAVDPAACVANARRFDVSVFKRELPREVERAVAQQPDDHRARPHVFRPPLRRMRRGGIARPFP
jgi:glycosyltransferase involved in cell wall biosynthesis